MVKKIEVLSVAEKNDEATLKIEFATFQINGGSNPKAKLTVWRKNAMVSSGRKPTGSPSATTLPTSPAT